MDTCVTDVTLLELIGVFQAVWRYASHIVAMWHSLVVTPQPSLIAYKKGSL
jgi:hypothetical protein